MKLPEYYCPHCRKFKKKKDITWIMHLGGYGGKRYTYICKHCDSKEVIKTEELFKKFVEEYIESETESEE